MSKFFEKRKDFRGTDMKKSHTSKPRFLATISLTALMGAVPVAGAQAQSVDYGAFQDLFGEAVTTSATGNPQRASDVPVTMEIITADDIRRSGARDIPGVLKGVTGVDVWQIDGQAADVGIRGYDQAFSSRLLVLVNGRQVYLDHFGFTAWSTIPVQLDEIRQIEVVKGPNSALFGFNAAGGVVNIITFNPLYDDVNKVAVQAGTQAHKGASVVSSFHFKGDNDEKKGGIRLSARASGSNHFDTEQPLDLNPRINPKQTNLKVDSLFQITNNSQFGIEASHSYAEETRLLPVYRPTSTQFDVNSLKATYLNESSLGLIGANVYRNWMIQDFRGGQNDGASINNVVTVAQLDDKFKIGANHNFRVALEYRNNQLESDVMAGACGVANPNCGSDDNLSYDVYSLSGMWNWAIRDNLSLTNAVRYDYLGLDRTGALDTQNTFQTNDDFNKNLNEVSVNSGVVWKASDKDTLRLTYGRGIQAPSLIDLGMQAKIQSPMGPNTALILGNPNMQAPVVSNYEVGYDRDLAGIDGKARVSLFYQNTQHVKSLLATNLLSGAFNVFQNGNIGSSSTGGIELGVEGKFKQYWNWDASYVYQAINDDIRNRDSSGVLRVPAEFEDSNADHRINAHLGYARDKWEVDGYASFISSHETVLFNGFDAGGPAWQQVNIGSHLNTSARVGYKITDNLTFAVSGTNLTYDNRRVNSGPEVERIVFATLTADF